VNRFWDALVAFSLRRPRAVIAAGFVLLAAAAPFAVRLYADLRTDLRELLPRGAPAAAALDALEQRVGTLGNLAVLVQSEDFARGERFVDALAARLQPLQPALIRDIRWRVDDERAFFDAHGALYADLQDLIRFRDTLRARKGRANPLFVELEAEEEDLSPLIDKLRSPVEHFSDGYLASKEERTLVLMIRPQSSALGLEGNEQLLAAVKSAVRDLNPARERIIVGYDGEVSEVIEAQEHLVHDLQLSSVLVVLAVGLAIFLYYRSLLSIPLLVGPLFIGAALTFALSRAAIGYLNPNTAFLGSIIIGNGVNAGIILLARYLEERRNKVPVEQALGIALRNTWLATLAASGAAAASYASLAATRFRGFNQFAFMGALGMILCWLTTYLLMPSWLVVAERMRPLGRRTPTRRFAAPFARFVARYAGLGAALSAALAIGAIALLARFAADPMEYDFSKLGSRRGAVDGAGYWGKRLDAVMRSYGTPTVILTETSERAEKVAAALAEEKKAQGESSAIDTVVSLQRLLPLEQEAKLSLLREIFALLDERTIRALPADLRPTIERLRATTRLEPVRLEDVPARYREMFRERDGQTGRLVLVYPTLAMSARQGRLQLSFARTLREVAQRVDPAAQVAGPLILTADIIETITRDGSFAALLSFGAVALLTLVILRSVTSAAWVVGSLCLGTLWMAGAFGALGVKLNFVNFVVLPITFGIGVDYAVNFFQRYRQAASAEQALAASGGAVALCSATTIIGYSALLVADNRAIFSFGLTAVLGEVTCLSAALFALPAVLAWRERRWEGRLKASAPEV
jgi:predicted RND superfamily exporter protein